jgi:hypothetical protein
VVGTIPQNRALAMAGAGSRLAADAPPSGNSGSSDRWNVCTGEHKSACSTCHVLYHVNTWMRHVGTLSCSCKQCRQFSILTSSGTLRGRVGLQREPEGAIRSHLVIHDEVATNVTKCYASRPWILQEFHGREGVGPSLLRCKLSTACVTDSTGVWDADPTRDLVRHGMKCRYASATSLRWA